MSQRIEASPVRALNAAGNGATTNIPFMGAHGIITIYVWGTFGGTSVKAQVSPNGTDWFDVTGPTALTAAGYLSFSNVAARAVRIVATGGTGLALSYVVAF